MRNNKGHWLFLLCLALLGITFGILAVVSAQPQRQETTEMRERARQNWEQEAEEAFSLQHGRGRQLMTQEEWQAHQRRMQQMSKQEREQYRHEWHTRMQERAKERGMERPEQPAPRGYGRGGTDEMGRGDRRGHGGGHGRP